MLPTAALVSAPARGTGMRHDNLHDIIYQWIMQKIQRFVNTHSTLASDSTVGCSTENRTSQSTLYSTVLNANILIQEMTIANDKEKQ